MSHEATAWAMRHDRTGPLDPAVRLVLLTLADHADPYGRAAWPSRQTIALRLGITLRSVSRSLDTLESLGLIHRGDQRLVSHLRGDRRPVVWDLTIDRPHARAAQEPEIGRDDETVTPSQPVDNLLTTCAQAVDNPVDNDQSRGDDRDAHGVTRSSPNTRTRTNYQSLTYQRNQQTRATRQTPTLRPPALGICPDCTAPRRLGTAACTACGTTTKAQSLRRHGFKETQR